MHAREQRTGATGKPAGQAGQAGQAGRARSGRPAPAGPAPGVPAADRPPDLLDLQRLAGNAAVSRALRQRGDRDAPGARQQRRGDQRVPVQQGDQRISVQRDDQRIPVQQGDQHIPVQQGDQRIPVQRGGGRAWGGAARYAEQPVEHPEWPLFRSLMRQAGFDQDTLEAVWQLLMGGIRQQEEVEKSLDDAHLSRSERRSRRSGNDWYRQVIDMVGYHLRIDTPTMGLWSGGLDVNDYASAKGHTTLEHSHLGRVINSLQLHPYRS